MSNLIDKDDAINAFTEWASENLIPHKYETWYVEGVKMFKNLPTHETDSNTLKALDCISRQAAIDAICTHGTELERRGVTVLAVVNHKQATVDLLEQLPPAEPEIIRCEDCIKQDLCSWYRDGAKYCSYAERRTDERFDKQGTGD